MNHDGTSSRRAGAAAAAWDPQAPGSAEQEETRRYTPLLPRSFERNLPQLSYEQELVIYRVAQEALTNLVRHAEASRVELWLARGPDRITLHVSDDGRGLNGAAPMGGGIRGMYERALQVNADLTVGGRPGGGTEVRLEVPVAEDGLWYR